MHGKPLRGWGSKAPALSQDGCYGRPPYPTTIVRVKTACSVWGKTLCLLECMRFGVPVEPAGVSSPSNEASSAASIGRTVAAAALAIAVFASTLPGLSLVWDEAGASYGSQGPFGFEID